MTTKNVALIGLLIREVICIEKPVVLSKILRSFMRIRVLVNVKEPLVTIFGFHANICLVLRSTLDIEATRLLLQLWHSGS